MQIKIDFTVPIVFNTFWVSPDQHAQNVWHEGRSRVGMMWQDIVAVSEVDLHPGFNKYRDALEQGSLLTTSHGNYITNEKFENMINAWNAYKKWEFNTNNFINFQKTNN